MATTRYVWEKWNCIAAQEYVGKITNERWTLRSNGSLSFYDNIYVNPKTGKVTLSGNVGSTGWDECHTSEYDYRHCSYQYYDNGPDNEYPQVHVFDKTLKVVQQLVYSKGTTSYGNVSSKKSSAYAANGVTGNYWYVSKGSDNIDPTALTYSDAVTAGQPVTLTIAPSTGTTLGGNISYVIQTTTNGTDWYDAGETSETSYTVTVPADAIVWNVRVYAKDDTGFTSSTYIYGNGVDTYVNVIRVGISPDSGDIGYITSPQVMFVSINTDTDYTFTVKLDGETLSSSSSSSTIQRIILSEEKFNSLKEETKYTLTIEIVQSGATITRTYTFKKFVYDDTTLGGVMEGAGKALRIKRKIQSQIVGANIPKEIIKIDNPIGVSDLAAATASEAQVFKGYTFFSGDNELKTGIALGTVTTATAGDIISGKTAYDNLGKLISGTGANFNLSVQSGAMNSYQKSNQGTNTFTFTLPRKYKYLVLFPHTGMTNSWGDSYTPNTTPYVSDGAVFCSNSVMYANTTSQSYAYGGRISMQAGSRNVQITTDTRNISSMAGVWANLIYYILY